MRKWFFLMVIIAVWVQCKTPEPRRPVSHSSGSRVDESVARNKKINAAEEAAINELMNNNPETDFQSSEHGFWYYYNEKSTDTTATPQVGDVVRFGYNLRSLSGDLIASREETGDQTYQIDQSNQELMSGLRQGLKLMRPGETVTFLFPSHLAYGYYGLAGKIGANLPLQATVTLKEIETKK